LQLLLSRLTNTAIIAFTWGPNQYANWLIRRGPVRFRGPPHIADYTLRQFTTDGPFPGAVFICGKIKFGGLK